MSYRLLFAWFLLAGLVRAQTPCGLQDNAGTHIGSSCTAKTPTRLFSVSGLATSLYPASFIFPGRNGNAISSSQTATATIIGNGRFKTSRISTGDAISTDFAQTDRCGSSVSAKNSCTVNIMFIQPLDSFGPSLVNDSENAAGSAQTMSVSETGSSSLTCGLLDDEQIHIPMNYTTFTPPAKGQSYTDDMGGCQITRISNAPKDFHSQVVHEYANVSAINSNDSYIALWNLNVGGVYIVDTQGKTIIAGGTLSDVAPPTFIRWSMTDPNTFYYPDINRHFTKGVISGCPRSCKVKKTVLRTFSEYPGGIYLGGGEGDISEDGDHVALVGGNGNCGSGAGNPTSCDVFVYTISTDTKGPVFNFSEAAHPFDNAKVTPLNEIEINWGLNDSKGSTCQNGPCYKGVELFGSGCKGVGCSPTSIKWVRRLTVMNEHSDVGRDPSGNETLYIADDGPWYCARGPGYVAVNIQSGVATCIWDKYGVSWGHTNHVSAHNTCGGVLIEDFDYAVGGTASYRLNANWQTFWTKWQNEVIFIQGDGSRRIRLFHPRSQVAGGYWKIPRATISRDCKAVVFDSDMGQGNPVRDYTDSYYVRLQP